MISVKLVENILIFSIIILYIQGVRLDADAEDSASGEARIVYDQRQSGKYNIHVVIKDVAIIEMDQNEIEDVDYSDDDYYYDENDLTVKPITLNPTTSTTKLSSTTIGIEPTKRQTTTSTSRTPSSRTTLTQVMTDSGTTLANQEEESTVDTTIWDALLQSTYPPKGVQEPTLNDPVKTSNTRTNFSETRYSFPNNLVEMKSRSKVEPIYALDEVPMQPKSREVSSPLETESKTLENSKIYKVKVHRSHHTRHPLRIQTRRCRSNQYRDISGNCRAKRSPAGSLLKRLFSMLVTLPFVRGESQHDNE